MAGGSDLSLAARTSLGSGPLSSRYSEALAYAAQHHHAQLRKGSRVPYLSHLLSVSALVLEHGGTENAAIAALLHDAVEDAPDGEGPAVLAEIETKFGVAVSATVRACSDGLDESGNRSGTWEVRKRPYLDALAHKTADAALVTAADKTHNARCIAADVATYGDDFWGVFNACRHRLAWYYATVRDRVSPLIPAPAAMALADAVDRLIAAAGTGKPDTSAGLPHCGCPPTPEK